MLRTQHILVRLCRLLPAASPSSLHNSLVNTWNGLESYPSTYKVSRILDKYTFKEIHTSPRVEKYNKKSSRNADDDSDDEDGDDEFKDERDSKVVKAKVNSLRADLLLKSGLNMARNKIETIFYESKIRINGNKLQKKSVQLNIGDEIDVIRGFSQENPSHLVISRVVILSASDREEGFSVNLRRYKSLLIENYRGANAYKSSEPTVQ